MRVAANEASSRLNAEIRSAFRWPESVEIEWRSPVRDDDYAEYYDDEFLECLGISHLRVPLSEFWPKSGPRWVDHPNQEQYPGQRLHVVAIEGYVYLVPFVETEDEVFLKTIIPSRKATRQYKGRDEN